MRISKVIEVTKNKMLENIVAMMEYIVFAIEILKNLKFTLFTDFIPRVQHLNTEKFQ